MRWTRAAAVGVVLAIGPIGLPSASNAAGARARGVAIKASQSAVPVRHVIEIMLENHSFDNLFGYLAGAEGIPPGTTFPSPFVAGDVVSPLLVPPDQGSVGPNLDNSRQIELQAMDRKPKGAFAMDRYTVTPYEGLASITVFPPSIDPNLQFLATHYALAESNFQPEVAPTLPNVLAAISGTSDGWYSNDDPPASDRFYTIFDQLQRAGRSWRVFNGAGGPATGTVWAQLVPAHETDNVVGTNQFIAEAANGTLPNFSFVRPGVGYSEESPEDTSLGDAWLGQLVLAAMRGPTGHRRSSFSRTTRGAGSGTMSPRRRSTSPATVRGRPWWSSPLTRHASSSARRRPTFQSCRSCRSFGTYRRSTSPTCELLTSSSTSISTSRRRRRKCHLRPPRPRSSSRRPGPVPTTTRHRRAARSPSQWPRRHAA